jgi:hypothetical protein
MASSDNATTDDLAFPQTSESTRVRLFQQVCLGAACMLLALWWTGGNEHDWSFFLGTIVCVLSLVPALAWTRKMEYNFPVFEVFIVTNLTSYGIPLLSEHDAVRIFREEVRQDSALLVIAFLLSACLAYYGTRAIPRDDSFWIKPVLARPNKQWMLNGLILSTLYTLVVPFLYAPPLGVEGILRAVFFGIGTSCIFIIAVAWGLGRLQRGEKAQVAVCLVLQFFLLSSALELRAGTATVLLGIIGFFFGARRIPYVTLALALVVIAVLNIGKYDLRQKYWTSESEFQPRLTELPTLYVEWFEAGIHPESQRNAKAGRLLLERNSLLQMLCLVVDQSPDPLPFLSGKTYAQIPGQFVPRIFWPEKPRGHISTYTLGIYYGLQDEDATYTTTIAFGFLPEAYANFGVWGVAGLGVVCGFCFRKITLMSVRSPIFSYGGLAMILLTAWSFQTELPVSAWLSSLFQGAVSVYAFVFVFRRFQEVTG